MQEHSVLGSLQNVDVASVANILEVYVACNFRSHCERGEGS